MRRPTFFNQRIAVVSCSLILLMVSVYNVSIAGDDPWNIIKIQNDSMELLHMGRDSLSFVEKNINKRNNYEIYNAYLLNDLSSNCSRYCGRLAEINKLRNDKKLSEKEGNVIAYFNESYVLEEIETVIKGYKYEARHIDLILTNTNNNEIKYLGQRIKEKLTDMIEYTEKLK